MLLHVPCTMYVCIYYIIYAQDNIQKMREGENLQKVPSNLYKNIYLNQRNDIPQTLGLASELNAGLVRLPIICWYSFTYSLHICTKVLAPVLRATMTLTVLFTFFLFRLLLRFVCSSPGLLLFQPFTTAPHPQDHRRRAHSQSCRSYERSRQ